MGKTSASTFDFSDFIAERTKDFTGREWVFAKIDAWLADADGARIFFLSGNPGSGKSAVAARLVQLARGEAPADACPRLAQAGLAYFHFCQALNDTVIEPLGFVKSLSLTLANRYPVYAQTLLKIGERHSELNIQQTVGEAHESEVTALKIETLEVDNLSARQAFAHLVREPLAALAQTGEADLILILMDALDEALAFDQNDNLVTLLADVTDDPQDLPHQVRFLVTSRFDPRVEQAIGQRTLDLIDGAPDNQRDVQVYAERRLTAVLADPAARHDLAERIAAAGAGNFLYARYVVEDLLQRPKDPASLTLPAGLNDIYAKFLKRELGREGHTWRTYRPLLGALVMARGRGLTRQQLAGILGERASAVEEQLEPCMQYLDGPYPDGPFHIYHQSFRDFLLASSQYRLEPDEVQADLAQYFWAEYWAFRDEGTPLDDYTIANLPAHLAEASRHEDLSNLRFDYSWLQTKLDRLGISALLADFSLSQPDADEVTRRLERSLVQGAHVLVTDRTQLAPQLLGRFLDDKSEQMQALLAQTRKQCRRPCLLPQTASLRETGALLRTLTGHTAGVAGIALTPDGRRAVSTSDDHTLKVWDLATGQALFTLIGHTGPVTGVALTPDGHRAVSASSDHTLKVWNLVTGQALSTLTGHTSPVTGVVLTPDGRRAISTSSDDTLKVWDLATGQALSTLTGHTAGVAGIALAPDGRSAVSASGDNTLKVWNLATGQALSTSTGHAGRVASVTLTPDGKQEISTSDGRTFTIWDSVTRQERFAGGPTTVTGVMLTPDGNRVISASSDNTLKIWDLATSQALFTLTGHTDAITKVVLTPDGNRAISASSDNTLKVWDLTTGHELFTLTGHSGRVTGVALMPDVNRAISISDDHTLKVWDLATGQALSTLTGHTDRLTSVVLASDGSRAISASSDATLKVWDLTTDQALVPLSGHTDRVVKLVLTPDGRRAVSASSDHTLKVWDLATGQALFTLMGHTAGVTSVVLTPDGSRAVSASSDYTLKNWDLTTGQVLSTLRGHMDRVTSIALTPDGNRAVSASSDHTLKVWDLATGQALSTLIGHTAGVTKVVLTPDGSRAVSASWDNTLKVWDLATGQTVFTLMGHTDAVTKVALTPDGKRVVSASWDTTLKVWDLATGQTLSTLRGHTSPFAGVALTPDGKCAVSASWDTTLKVWDLATGQALSTLTGHTSPLAGVALAPDGKRAISTSWDSTLKVWDLTSGACLTTFHADGSLRPCAATADGAMIVTAGESGRPHFLQLLE